MTYYIWIVWLHVASVFGFLIAHGGASLAVFIIRAEREPERLKALLTLSRRSSVVSYVFVILVLATGVTLGFLGGWWGQYWIWTAILTAFVMTGLMYKLGTEHMNKLRKAVGLPYYENRKKQAPSPVSNEEIEQLASSSRPALLSAIGTGGLLIILWLMFLKPF
jgi:hypothetical protein